MFLWIPIRGSPEMTSFWGGGVRVMVFFLLSYLVNMTFFIKIWQFAKNFYMTIWTWQLSENLENMTIWNMTIFYQFKKYDNFYFWETWFFIYENCNKKLQQRNYTYICSYSLKNSVLPSIFLIIVFLGWVLRGIFLLAIGDYLEIAIERTTLHKFLTTVNFPLSQI